MTFVRRPTRLSWKWTKVCPSHSCSGLRLYIAATYRRAGLRSCAVGEQCEAIVKCPELMDKFPLPVMTSTALLKLADVFSAQSTGNLLRLHILRVFQLSQHHLGKVTNLDELVRRLSLVSHSNDPVARALTLRSARTTLSPQ